MTLDALIDGPVIGLLHAPPDYAAPRPGLRHLWRRHVVANGYVRSAAYMRALFESRFPRGRLVEIGPGALSTDDVDAQASTFVLLYPDPIGLDFGWAERELRSRGAKTVLALTGRGRLLRLDAATRAGLAWRRALAKVRPLEFAFLIAFIVATPFMWALDQLRGQR